MPAQPSRHRRKLAGEAPKRRPAGGVAKISRGAKPRARPLHERRSMRHRRTTKPASAAAMVERHAQPVRKRGSKAAQSTGSATAQHRRTTPRDQRSPHTHHRASSHDRRTTQRLATEKRFAQGCAA
ncbi:Methyl binding domain protein [Dorcoceras hygrometricum]|uniref:Methyl binding domain protein n=1 Tax=Dorcoceras hygrometricum TaxID=472368 RepID=A0A2Z7BGG1_9LAMI|nr:Methyl binding domain protein [Dorcoceras hygrometricum]